MIRIKKNPTDHEFLSKIYIEKEFDLKNKRIIYWAQDNQDEVLGSAYYNIDKKWILDIEVEPEYRRKGLASFLYNYIENDQKIKLKPSSTLFPDGKAFWSNRSKKKNPTDREFLNKISIVKIEIKGTPYIKYIGYYNQEQVIYVLFNHRTELVELVETEENYQRKGLATYLYDYIEKDQRLKLKPSEVMLSDGKAFWKARRKNKK